MIAPEARLSISRQCSLLGLARSSFYYRPRRLLAGALARGAWRCVEQAVARNGVPSLHHDQRFRDEIGKAVDDFRRRNLGARHDHAGRLQAKPKFLLLRV